MRFNILILALFTGFQLSAQPDKVEIGRMLDSFDFGQQDDRPAISEMASEEHTEITNGSFINADREEYLIEVLLVTDTDSKQFAFIGYQDDDNMWQRSNWFLYGYTSLDVIDVQNDGMKELIHQVILPGNRKNQQRYRLISIEDDIAKEIYKIDGFSINTDYVKDMRAGDHVSRTFDVMIEDLDGDGVAEITETITDDYYLFGFEDNNENREYEPMVQQQLPGSQQKTTVFGIKKGKLVVLEVR